MSRKRSRPLQRDRDPKPIRRILRVYVEGAVTERQYLEELGRRYRDNVIINFGSFGKAPSSLVNSACYDVEENRRRGQRRDPLYDEVWCVFDKDEHPDIDRLIKRAFDNNVNVAYSNPCFELWLVLHRQDQTAYIDRYKVQRLANTLGIIKGKTIKRAVLGELIQVYEDAKCRARWLDRMHSGDGRLPRSNPSTGVWRLVDSLRRTPSVTA